jgi:predicted DsbA family dithiol-disulfide isomerase
VAVPTVEVFADVVCPFAHVGLRRFVARRTELGRSRPLLRVRAWPLEVVNAKPFDPESVARNVVELRRQVAPELFDGFTPSAVPPTSLPAFALVADAAAVSDELGEAVSLAVRAALFDEGRDVADPDVLAGIAAAHGVEERTAAAVTAYQLDYDEGRRRGVQGSPHFFVGEHDYFCPALRIDRSDGDFTITPSPARLEELLDTCFASEPTP